MINKIELSIEVADPVLPVIKKIFHQKLEINENLEMFQKVRVVCYEKNQDGTRGIAMLQAIENDNTLNEEAKKWYREVFKDRFYEADTVGVMVNPTTGEIVVPVDGAFPEGSISELEYWQNYPSNAFTSAALANIAPGVTFYDGSKLCHLIYNGLILSALKIAQRGRI